MPIDSSAATADEEPKLANGKQREVADENSSSSSSDLKLKIDVDEETTDTATKQTTQNNKTDKVLNFPISTNKWIHFSIYL